MCLQEATTPSAMTDHDYGQKVTEGNTDRGEGDTTTDLTNIASELASSLANQLSSQTSLAAASGESKAEQQLEQQMLQLQQQIQRQIQEQQIHITNIQQQKQSLQQVAEVSAAGDPGALQVAGPSGRKMGNSK